MTEARSLDRALFEHRFEAAPVDRVVEELLDYQNPDGGFGHALEPDVRTPGSSALATGIALDILKEVGRASRSPVVTRAVEFLLDTFDAETRVWRVVPEDTNDYPHAPWWHDEEGSLAQTFDDFAVIPRAQLVALLHHYGGIVPDEWLERLTENTVTAVQTLDEAAFAGGGDTLRYALDLFEADALPVRFKNRLMPRLQDLTDRIVCRDPGEWSQYCATPLKVALSPDSAVADMLQHDLQRNLDFVIDEQSQDGAWEPTWTWGDVYPAAWEQARQEWRSELTLRTLTTLRAFGRISC